MSKEEMITIKGFHYDKPADPKKDHGPPRCVKTNEFVLRVGDTVPASMLEVLAYPGGPPLISDHSGTKSAPVVNHKPKGDSDAQTPGTK